MYMYLLRTHVKFCANLISMPTVLQQRRLCTAVVVITAIFLNRRHQTKIADFNGTVHRKKDVRRLKDTTFRNETAHNMLNTLCRQIRSS